MKKVTITLLLLTIISLVKAQQLGKNIVNEGMDTEISAYTDLQQLQLTGNKNIASIHYLVQEKDTVSFYYNTIGKVDSVCSPYQRYYFRWQGDTLLEMNNYNPLNANSLSISDKLNLKKGYRKVDENGGTVEIYYNQYGTIKSAYQNKGDTLFYRLHTQPSPLSDLILDKKGDTLLYQLFDTKHDTLMVKTKEAIVHYEFNNDHQCTQRTTLNQEGKRIETFNYSQGGKLVATTLQFIPSKDFKPKDDSDGYRKELKTYAYIFDSNGNWTSLSISTIIVLNKDNSKEYKERNSLHRWITYYK